MSSNGGSSRESSGTMVWGDMQTVPPPNYHLMNHLLASHHSTSTGLFSLCAPVKLRAHGTEPLPDAAHDYIVKNKLLLQQSISCGFEHGSSCKAMLVDILLFATDHAPDKADMIIISRVIDRSLADVIHQLHIRKYNIVVTSSFPPKLMTPLRQCGSPLGLLGQMFPYHDSLPNTKEVKLKDCKDRATFDFQKSSVPMDIRTILNRARSEISDPVLHTKEVNLGNRNDREVGKQKSSVSINKTALLPRAKSEGIDKSLACKNGETDTATSSQLQGCSSQLTNMYCSLLMENCRNLVQEFLLKGITEFAECEFRSYFRMRFEDRLNHRAAGFSTFDDFLQVAVPNVNFTSKIEGTRPWIVCSSPGHPVKSSLPLQTTPSTETASIPNSIHVSQAVGRSNTAEDLDARQKTPFSDGRPIPSTQVPQVAYCGPITMEEVRIWLDEMVASGRANSGINLSLLGKDFEDHTGKNLNYKSLQCSSLMLLLSKFEYLVRLERSMSMVHIFPAASNMIQTLQSRKRARPIVPDNVAVDHLLRSQRLSHLMNSTPGVCVPPRTSISRFVQASAQISITKPSTLTTVLVSKSSMAVSTAMRTSTAPASITKTAPSISEENIEPAPVQLSETAPTSEENIEPASVTITKTDPLASELKIEPALMTVVTTAPLISEMEFEPAGKHTRERNYLPNANTAPPTCDPGKEIQESPLPKVKQIPASRIPAAEPKSSQISIEASAQALHASKMSFADPVPVPMAAPSNSKTIVEPGGEAKSLSNADVAVSTSDLRKIHQAKGCENKKQGNCGDAKSGQKFDIYSLKVVQERQAIKQTFESVNLRLREEFKKRRLAAQPVNDPSDKTSNV